MNAPAHKPALSKADRIMYREHSEQMLAEPWNEIDTVT